MNELIVEATGLPLRFPDPREEAYQRAQEFRRLTPDDRWRTIASLVKFGLNMARSSLRHAAIEQRWQAQEEEWRRLQRELIVQHGQ